MRTLGSLRWMLGCLFFVPSALVPASLQAADSVTEVSVDEATLPQMTLDGASLGGLEFVPVPEERELELPAEGVVTPISQEVKPFSVATARELLETDEAELARAGRVFRSMLSQSTVRDETRLVFLHPQKGAEDEKAIASGRFDSEKVYSFDSAGRLVEVKPSLVVAKRDQKRKIEGNGWTVLAVDENTSQKSTTGFDVAGSLKVERNFNIPNSSGLFSAAGMAGENDLKLAQSASASKNGNVFSIAPEMLPDELKIGNGNSVSGSPEAATTTSRIVIRGRVLIPTEVSASDLRIRVGGTDIEIVPDGEGVFEIPEMPRGSKFELLVWDVGGKLSRRLVPVSAAESGREIEFSMEFSRKIEAISASFGVEFDMMSSGFCGRILAVDSALVEGAHVSVRTRGVEQETRYYSANGLPSRVQREASVDGRVCAFNLPSGITDVEVRLANGTRRLFSINSKPSTFESDIDFDMIGAIYRPVSAFELVDFDEAVNATSRGQKLVFGTPGTRNWYDGSRSATWTGVTAFSAAGDNAYSGLVYEGKPGEWALFQRGEELVEVRAGKSPETLSVFALVGRDELRTSGMETLLTIRDEGRVFRDRTAAMRLHLLPDDALDEMARATGIERNAALGSAFVDVDVAALGLTYAETRVAVRDAWTGEYVGKVSYVSPQSGSANPRYLRLWVTNLPLGQHTLVVTGKSGSLHSLQILRSRPGDFQIVTIGE